MTIKQLAEKIANILHCVKYMWDNSKPDRLKRSYDVSRINNLGWKDYWNRQS